MRGVGWWWGILWVLASGCTAAGGGSAREYNQRGVALLAQKDFQGAKTQFEEAVRLAPRDPDTLYNVATAAHHLGQGQVAEHYYRQCLQQDAEHAKAQHGLLVLYWTEGKTKEVDRLTAQRLQAQADNADALTARAWFLRETGDLPAAQAMLHRAMDIQPDHTQAMMELAILYEIYNMPDRSRSLYQQVLRREPYHAEARDRLMVLQKR